MKVRINKCNDSLLWYAEKIGEVFDVQYVLKESNGYSYWVNTNDSYSTRNFIYNHDCSEVNE